MHYDNYNLHCVISIHALLAESDPIDVPQYQILDISIHALLAESDDVIAVITDAQSISIHALLAESDRRCSSVLPNRLEFLSTLSLRRATSMLKKDDHETLISIHALLAESDAPTARVSLQYRHFYPRSPCGERHDYLDLCVKYNIFLSTLSLRRATS